MEWHGMARHGTAQQGTARHGGRAACAQYGDEVRQERRHAAFHARHLHQPASPCRRCNACAYVTRHAARACDLQHATPGSISRSIQRATTERATIGFSTRRDCRWRAARADRVGERTLTLQWRPSRMSACPPPLTSPPDGRGCHGTDRCVPPWHTLSYRPVPAGRRGLEAVGVCARAPCVRARSCMRGGSCLKVYPGTRQR